MKQIDTKLINWSVVCVNEFAKSLEMSLREAFEYLYMFGGISFLKEHYEAEHLLSIEDTVEDLLIVCRNNGGHL